MLFNSAQFLFLFLPVAVAGYLLLLRRHTEASIWWLLLASLVFYSAWNSLLLPLLIGSIVANYLIVLWMTRSRHRTAILVGGLVFNLGLLFYFKYAGFVAGAVGISWQAVVLPLGISFFTFQQVAHLVDVYRAGQTDAGFSRYALFVAFFPHLIAGPLTHHSEMVPQFGRKRPSHSEDIAVGTTLLLIGLIKKVAIADTMAIPASAMFDAVAAGGVVSMADAWIGSICYALQLYFDFSGYSDMAIGVARMMGIDFPINFASPYKARSITDFWRRWHITLSRLLRDYLYIPLGGSRAPKWRHRLNLFLTMLIGGVWHGAGWTFVVWGAMHGAFLLTHHWWRGTALGQKMSAKPWWGLVSWTLTLIAVVVAWVPFRASGMEDALSIWHSMLGGNWTKSQLLDLETLVPLALFGTIALFGPNAYQLLASLRVGLPTKGYPATESPQAPSFMQFLLWTPAHAAIAGTALAVVILKLNDISAFIYFQF